MSSIATNTGSFLKTWVTRKDFSYPQDEVWESRRERGVPAEQCCRIGHKLSLDVKDVFHCAP